MAEPPRQGKLKLKPLEGSITCHDPCRISRRGGATAGARNLLRDFAKDFHEMSPRGALNWRRGGGGGGGGGVQALGRAAETQDVQDQDGPGRR